MKTEELYNQSESFRFYQERYSQGYMEEWPREKKRRVFDMVRSLQLPKVGEAVDYGCGNGVFTDVLRQALPPGWVVYGVDISDIAIANAAKRYPDCKFFTASDSAVADKKFDFLFSHHVLEHVYELALVIADMGGRVKPTGMMLHILPCGNDGSLERQVCLLRKNGIEERLEGRFFFEDLGHVRRLKSEQVVRAFEDIGFAVEAEWFSNQYHGAIDWITQSGPAFIRMLTDPDSAVDASAKMKLLGLRAKLLTYCSLRNFDAGIAARLQKKGKTPKNWLSIAMRALPHVVARGLDKHLVRKAEEEWQEKKHEPNVSEMYLVFRSRVQLDGVRGASPVARGR